MIGVATECVRCGAATRSCTLPATCWRCDPHARRVLRSIEDRLMDRERGGAAEGAPPPALTLYTPKGELMSPTDRSALTPTEYQRLAARTECDQAKSRHRMAEPHRPCPDAIALDQSLLVPIRVNHAVIGMAGEVGELASILQKWIYYGKADYQVPGSGPEHLRRQLGDELGDVLWYVALACNALGLDLGMVMARNLAKLRARYPTRYTDEHAADEARDRAAEARAQTDVGEVAQPSGACRNCSGLGVVTCTWSSAPTPCPVCAPPDSDGGEV